MAKYVGKVWIVGDDVDTDLIIAARYLNDSSEDFLKEHCLEDVIPDFHNKIAKGDILVAGKNFGCGSSREHAPVAIKATGISCVVAESFARIFYRNAINIGLPIFTAPEAVKAISQGEEIVVDSEEGYVEQVKTGQKYEAEKFPSFIQEIIEAGNLLNYVQRRVQKND
ncbi:MAG: 3-isopropylmalate dehydratase small subunit [Clostridia bacterium]|jgi:3-isopropylmalate/(R)-2-methylmalate dehydratase small subunit|nr:3-isopropylmalate dehydratase small subunit [Clostridia bacterium]